MYGRLLTSTTCYDWRPVILRAWVVNTVKKWETACLFLLYITIRRV